MTAAIFAGPTLGRTLSDPVGEFRFLPPAAQGDVYRLAMERPSAIGIIDGYFSGAPSVWHKEILWAMSQGIPMFGSASMGALRAAELCEFGMRGIGRIFEAFRDGILEDDDEVAVTHGPAELSYVPTSEAMVNIRSTLVRAEAEGVICASTCHALEMAAKSRHFADRTWPGLLEDGRAAGLDALEMAGLEAWLPGGMVDQKRLDAVEMLEAIEASLSRKTSNEPTFRFEWTRLFDDLVARSASSDGLPHLVEAALDELRLEGPSAYRRVEDGALLRLVANRGLDRPAPLSDAALSAALVETRSRLRLFSRADLLAWMSANALDEAALRRLVEDEACLAELRRLSGPSLEPGLVDEMRMSGLYERLAARALNKEQVLARAEPGRVPADSPELSALKARHWYFEKRLRIEFPEDLAGFASSLGYRDLHAFDRAIQREQAFLSVNQEYNSS
jgi:hypothetical protein